MGRATKKRLEELQNTLFQSTPSVGRATQSTNGEFSFNLISIHALRGEGDDELTKVQQKLDISIHALRGEGDAFAEEAHG